MRKRSVSIPVLCHPTKLLSSWRPSNVVRLRRVSPRAIYKAGKLPHPFSLHLESPSVLRSLFTPLKPNGARVCVSVCDVARAGIPGLKQITVYDTISRSLSIRRRISRKLYIGNPSPRPPPLLLNLFDRSACLRLAMAERDRSDVDVARSSLSRANRDKNVDYADREITRSGTLDFAKWIPLADSRNETREGSLARFFSDESRGNPDPGGGR